MNKERDTDRTAELVKGGSWAEYFKSLDLGVWNASKYEEILKLFESYYGDFHQKYLDPQGGPLLELGVGTGISALPLISLGHRVIGLDNDENALKMCDLNKKLSPYPEKLKLVVADLYDSRWHEQFINNEIQCVVSYGVLEHFTEESLSILVPQQFNIATLAIAMVPVNTPQSLKFFGATGKESGDIDKNGIFRIFRTTEYWQKEIFEKNGCQIISTRNLSSLRRSNGEICDMTIFSLKAQKSVL